MRREIPPALTKNILSLSGDDGARWLAELPSHLSELEREWEIVVDEPFENGEYNYVARARTVSGGPCVIKVAPPRNDRDHFGEVQYLRLNDGHGAVKLLMHDVGRMAMLIERAVPGKTLTRIFEGREGQAIEPAIGSLTSVSRAIPNDLADVILLDEWFDGLQRAAGTAFPQDYAKKALEIYARLGSDGHRVGYLHGDFHPDNIVSADRCGFLLIDPKGMIGHLGYEIAVFLNNFHWWQDEAADIRERLQHATRKFSEAFAIPANELREWAFAQMVLSAWWTFDEMPDLYDNEVAKADIWDV